MFNNDKYFEMNWVPFEESCNIVQISAIILLSCTKRAMQII